MAWEIRRNGRRYYYRGARRIDGRVVKHYLGAGPSAQAAAAEDAARREEKESARRARRAEREQFEQIANEIRDLDNGFKTLLAGMLSRAGFHEHRGEWRRRRGQV